MQAANKVAKQNSILLASTNLASMKHEKITSTVCHWKIQNLYPQTSGWQVFMKTSIYYLGIKQNDCLLGNVYKLFEMKTLFLTLKSFIGLLMDRNPTVKYFFKEVKV